MFLFILRNIESFICREGHAGAVLYAILAVNGCALIPLATIWSVISGHIALSLPILISSAVSLALIASARINKELISRMKNRREYFFGASLYFLVVPISIFTSYVAVIENSPATSLVNFLLVSLSIHWIRLFTIRNYFTGK